MRKDTVMVRVRLFHELRNEIGQSEIEVEAITLNDVVQSLIERRDTVKPLLFDTDGKLRSQILFYVNNSILKPVDLARKLNHGDIVLLVPPAAGG